VERLKIVGFEVGGDTSTDAWAIWQANSLDVESVIAHTEAGKSGRCYLLVDPTGDDGPRITAEHASQVVVAHDPGDRRKRLAALKVWADNDEGFQYATLYLPDVVLKFEAEQTNGQEVEWVERSGVPPEEPNPLGVVPIVPLENKPGLLGTAHSDLEPAIPLQNAVNKICSDMIVNSEYGAFPQRVLTGVEVPKDPQTGQPMWNAEELKAAMSRLWLFEKENVKAQSLPAADMQNFVVSVEMLIQHLAAQTRTPPHYLLAKMVNASGDALATAEAGLVKKCEQKTLFFSDSWEEAMALALSASGAEVVASDCEAKWANPERLSQSQLTDAEIKKKTLGVPLPVIWGELGYTPEEITEMEKQLEARQEAQLEAAALLQEAQVRATVQAAPPPPGAPEVTAPQTSAPTPPAQPPTQGGSSA